MGRKRVRYWWVLVLLVGVIALGLRGSWKWYLYSLPRPEVATFGALNAYSVEDVWRSLEDFYGEWLQYKEGSIFRSEEDFIYEHTTRWHDPRKNSTSYLRMTGLGPGYELLADQAYILHRDYLLVPLFRSPFYLDWKYDIAKFYAYCFSIVETLWDESVRELVRESYCRTEWHRRKVNFCDWFNHLGRWRWPEGKDGVILPDLSYVTKYDDAAKVWRCEILELDEKADQDWFLRLAEADKVIELATRYKTQTEGWLPGETIQGIALYAKIRPRAIICDDPQEIEFIWVVRFGRRNPDDLPYLARTTQEFWINARTGFVRAILPPGHWPIAEAPSRQPEPYLEEAASRQAQRTEEAIRKCRNVHGELLLLRYLSGPAKPFPSTDFLLSFRYLDILTKFGEKDNESVRQNHSLSIQEQALLDELRNSKVPNPDKLAKLLTADAYFSEDDGILVRCMTGTTATIWLIRLGRDVPGFGQEGDLVWVANQVFGPVTARAGWRYCRHFDDRPCPWAPYFYRQVWVNAHTGKIFSLLSTDPGERIKPLQIPSTKDYWRNHYDWCARCKECFAKLRIEDRAWLTYWRRKQ